MDPLQRISRDFAYNAWANRETLRALASQPAAPPRAAEVMAHLVGAEWAWLRRLGPAAPDMPVWPNLPLPECDRQLRTLSATWKRYVAGLTPEALDRELAYVNFKGEHWTNTVGDVLTHVITHACYHRGQIASFLGRAGHPVPYTDYIECVRQGHLPDAWGD
jgi:uncharacterized damage-inducible protein DinB